MNKPDNYKKIGPPTYVRPYNKLFRLILPLLILLFAYTVRAEVRLPAIIGDNMVLQQGTKVRIWGKAKAGERVIVTFQNKTTESVADAQGRWQVLIGPLKSGGTRGVNC